MRYLSPLRYPGGKGRLANYLKLLFHRNKLLDGCYVEPYAGGASIALHLLFGEYVHDVFINDLDVAIYAFWHSVLFDTPNLCKKILETDVSMHEWYRQRDIYKRRFENNIDLLALGFATFFLNRTNRSGIISGGVIGGLDQAGKWKIDARYNKEELVFRIEKISSYGSRIHLYNLDAVKFMEQIDKGLIARSLIYLDPPYYKKGQELYENHYCHGDHILISEMLKGMSSRWLLTYDNVPVIQKLYGNYKQLKYSLSYSASKKYSGSELMVFCDRLILPELTNPVSVKDSDLKYSYYSQLNLLLSF